MNAILRLVKTESHTPVPRGWSPHEMAKIYQVEYALSAYFGELDFDTGVSDDGDPWATFADLEDGLLYAHITREKDVVVFDLPELGLTYEGRTLHEAIDRVTAGTPIAMSSELAEHRFRAHVTQLSKLGGIAAVLFGFLGSMVPRRASAEPLPVSQTLETVAATTSAKRSSYAFSFLQWPFGAKIGAALTATASFAHAGEAKPQELDRLVKDDRADENEEPLVITSVDPRPQTTSTKAYETVTEEVNSLHSEPSSLAFELEKFLGGSGRSKSITDDAIYGTPEDDFIVGSDRDDLIFAGAGDDIVKGGAGNDTIFGEAGEDVVYGEAGNDVIDGGDGDDLLDGGVGNDTLLGGFGDDQLFGGAGKDTLLGGHGNDELFGASGGDLVDGEDGDDLLDGGAGDDTLLGGAGDDKLLGDTGDDVMNGEAGNDDLHGGAGRDFVSGSFGDDILHGFWGKDIIHGGEGRDVINGGTQDDIVHGDDGDDDVSGGVGNDTVYGDEGNDKVRGSFGDDTLYGGSGDDRVLGGTGDDVMNGGTGDDKIFGGDGNDILMGDEGADWLDGGEGDDVLHATLDDRGFNGGDGANDTLYITAASVNLTTGVAKHDSHANQKILNIENLIMGDGDTFIRGSEADNHITLGKGQAVVDLSDGGNDTLRGFAFGDSNDDGDTLILEHLGVRHSFTKSEDLLTFANSIASDADDASNFFVDDNKAVLKLAPNQGTETRTITFEDLPWTDEILRDDKPYGTDEDEEYSIEFF